jgi:Tfp pilus assembly protein PilN
MKIRLNVATQPLETHRRFLAEAAVAGAVGLLLLLALSTSVFEAWRQNRGQREQIARYEAQLVRIDAERQQLAAYFNSPRTRTVMDRAAFLNSLIDQRSFPWTKIFTDLEKVLPPGVRVVSIAPKMEKGQVEVKLVIGAASDASKVDFLKALQQSPAFSQVEVTSETRATGTSASAGTPDVVEVELNALYSGAAAGQ